LENIYNLQILTQNQKYKPKCKICVLYEALN